MPNLKTTLGVIRSHSPCESGLKKLCKTFGTDPETAITLLQILDSNGVNYAYWALRCWDYKEYCSLLAKVAEAVAGDDFYAVYAAYADTDAAYVAYADPAYAAAAAAVHAADTEECQEQRDLNEKLMREWISK